MTSFLRFENEMIIDYRRRGEENLKFDTFYAQPTERKSHLSERFSSLSTSKPIIIGIE